MYVFNSSEVWWLLVTPKKPRTSLLNAQDLYLTVKTPAVVKVGVAGVARVELDVGKRLTWQ